jgi:osmotically-inducible protein OsmY
MKVNAVLKVALVATLALAAPATAQVEAGIVVEAQRLSDDHIQSMVMDKLAANPRLTGRIGVTTRDAVVTLSGWTLTAGQAFRAEADARNVSGVRSVRNDIRPRLAA